jgi:hypothetical protein
VVQERLGHANISITLDTYSHVIAGLHEEAAEQVAALFRAPVSNPLAKTARGAEDVAMTRRFVVSEGDLNSSFEGHIGGTFKGIECLSERGFHPLSSPSGHSDASAYTSGSIKTGIRSAAVCCPLSTHEPDALSRKHQ